MPFMISSVNVAMPDIQEGFLDQGIDAVLLSWLATSYLLAAGVSLVPAGRLADIVGRKKILAAGFGLFVISSFFCFLADHVYLLLFLRGLQGLGGGMIFGTGMAILTSVFPPQSRGKVLGLAVSAVYVGLSTGPFVGGLVTHYFGWRVLFLTAALLGIIPLIVLILFLQGEWAEAEGESYDLIGALLYVPSLIALIYGFSLLPQLLGSLILLSGFVGLSLFLFHQSRQEEPLLQVNLYLRNRTFALSNAAALIHYSATFGLMFLMSLYLQYIHGLDSRTAGTILMAQPVMMALFSPVAGKISDKSEPRVISSLGMGLTAGGLLFFSFLGYETPLWRIVTALLFLGFGFALFSSPNMNAIMGSVERKYLGVASGSAGTMRVIGQMLSMGIVTLVLSLYLGERPITPDLFDELLASVRWTFRVFTLLCIIGIFTSLARGNLHEKKSR